MRKRVGEREKERDQERESFKREEKREKKSYLIRTPQKITTGYPGKWEVDCLLDSPFKNDRERIKYYSKRYADKTIAEAFADEYDLKLKKVTNLAPIANVNVNDIVTLKIEGIDKSGVILDNSNLKYDVKFSMDLYKMSSLAESNFPIELPCMVIAKEKNCITVDPLAAAYKNFVSSYNKEGIEAQYKADKNEVNCFNVKDLKLIKTGYVGNLVVPELSKITGKDTTIKAFIPGSQIVQNVESDFDRWVGCNVMVFITNIIKPEDLKPGDIQVICSRKNVINHLGNLNMIDIFKDYTEQNSKWKKLTNKTFEGVVTGVVNTSKKCGVFVEVPELMITKLINKPANELVNYKASQAVKVKLVDFEESTSIGTLGQTVHNEPYIIEDGVIKAVNVKPIFEIQ